MEDAAQNKVFGEKKKNWGWMFALGILMLVLGTIGLGMSVTLSIVSMLYFGILMLFGSGVQLVQAFRSVAWRGRLGHVLIAVLYLFAGATMLTNPELASVTLTLFIAWALVVVGGLRSVR